MSATSVNVPPISTPTRHAMSRALPRLQGTIVDGPPRIGTRLYAGLRSLLGLKGPLRPLSVACKWTRAPDGGMAVPPWGCGHHIARVAQYELHSCTLHSHDWRYRRGERNGDTSG